jgi:hypothetical protein
LKIITQQRGDITARPKKDGVDYFPHDVSASNSRTVFTLESKFGNDGYAFWFKLLEILGSQSGHYYDCRNPANWLFLLAKTHLSDVSATEILETLVQVDAIDADLWHVKVIWVNKFSARLSVVYDKRVTETPQKPSFSDGNPTNVGISVSESTQSKVKESKVKESKGESTEIPPTPPKKPKVDKKTFGEFQRVKLTDEEHAKLNERLGEKITAKYITNLDEWIESKNKRVASAYATILSWWHKDGDPTDKSGNKPSGAKPDYSDPSRYAGEQEDLPKWATK